MEFEIVIAGFILCALGFEFGTWPLLEDLSSVLQSFIICASMLETMEQT